jgi:hypothetical protein
MVVLIHSSNLLPSGNCDRLRVETSLSLDSIRIGFLSILIASVPFSRLLTTRERRQRNW